MVPRKFNYILTNIKIRKNISKKKNEELKEISKLMSTIKDLMSTINQQLYEDDEKIQSIEDCIDESIENVKKGCSYHGKRQ